MHFYSAYTLRIGSDIPLLELPAAQGPADVTIQLMPPMPNEIRSIEWNTGGISESCFRFAGVGKFLVRAGRQVSVTPDPKAEIDLLRLYVQGMILAAVLYQRGYFVLHSSVVSINGGAVAFTGQVGAGKSSLAAAFHSLGYGLLADDNAAICSGSGQPQVLPAFPSIKVYPEVASSLGYSIDSLQRLHNSQIKRAQSVAKGFATVSLPLRAIYALDRDAPPDIQSLAPIQAVTEMIRHSVPTRWSVAGDLRHLQACSDLANSTPVFRVRTFAELGEIPAIVKRIEDHQKSFAANAA